MGREVVVRIPDPSVVVLVGPAGSGKSTFAARHFAPDEVLSSDAHRARIAGDEADQRATAAAFTALHGALGLRLRAGQLSVVDATNLTWKARAAIVRQARAAGVPAVAIVLDLPLPEVLRRNAGRRRVVPEAVVRRHAAALAALGPGRLEAEGHALVVRLRTIDEIAAVRIERVEANVPRGHPAGGVDPDRPREADV